MADSRTTEIVGKNTRRVAVRKHPADRPAHRPEHRPAQRPVHRPEHRTAHRPANSPVQSPEHRPAHHSAHHSGRHSAHHSARRSTIFDYINVAIMVVMCFFVLYPIWYILVNSLNEGQDAVRGGIYWWPRIITLDNYRVVFYNKDILNAFIISIAKTVIGALTSVFFTAAVAYSLSKQELLGRKLYLMIGTITLFFSGGLIPNFLLIKSIGLYNNFWVYIIPSLFSFYPVIIFLAYYRQLPDGLEEAAKIDGANELYIFWKIILPLSMPIIATFLLFNGVAQWNDYFTPLIYTNGPKLQPVQLYLYRIIVQQTQVSTLSQFQANIPDSQKTITPEAITLATMIVTTAPIVIIYPFLQKYFIKGMLVGSIKG